MNLEQCQNMCDALNDARVTGPSDATACSAISDTDRLDWLQAHQKTAWRVTHDEWEQMTETRARHVKITVFDGWVVNEQDEPKKDIRVAIDSAIHSQNAPVEGPPTQISTEENK